MGEMCVFPIAKPNPPKGTSPPSHQGRATSTAMEGLIPYVYRAIRRKRARRHYRCLSSGSALSVVTTPKFLTPPPEHNARHRRHRSMEGLPGELSPEAFPERRRLGKRSSFVFACVAGA